MVERADQPPESIGFPGTWQRARLTLTTYHQICKSTYLTFNLRALLQTFPPHLKISTEKPRFKQFPLSCKSREECIEFLERIPVIPPTTFLPPSSTGHLSKLVPASAALLTLLSRSGNFQVKHKNAKKDYWISPLSSWKTIFLCAYRSWMVSLGGKKSARIGRLWWNLNFKIETNYGK